jgi:hypothetical protein
VTADGKYAFVAGRNSNKIILGEPQAGGNIGIIKDPLGPNPKLVAATEQMPEIVTNNVALYSDGKYLIGSYPTLGGSGNAYVFDVGEIIKTVENPGGYDLTKVGVDKINPKVVSKSFATGGNPLGLVVAQKPKPDSGKKLSQQQRDALITVLKNLLEFFKPLGEFVAGAVYQWLHDNGDIARWLLEIFIPGWNGLERDVEKELPQTWAFKAGQTLGDGVAIVTGILEMIGGGGAAAGGGALCITGIGCIAGAPALVAAAALEVHGGATASAGLANIAKQLGVVFHSSTGSSSGSSGTGSQGGTPGGGGSSALNWNWKSKPTFGHTFETHGQGPRNTRSLTGRAASTQAEQGQWLDNAKAANFLQDMRPKIGDTPIQVDIPENLGQVILPNGTIVPATRAQIVPVAGGGYKTAYPISSP